MPYTIEVSKLIYDVLTKMKENLTPQIGDKASYTLVLQILLREHYLLPKCKKKKKELQEEIKTIKNNHEQFMKKLLLEKTSHPVMAVPNYQVSTPMMAPPLSPPPKPPKPLQKITVDISNIKTPQEIKAALAEESKQVFDGVVRKPSEILAMTKPKHASSEVKQFEGTPPTLNNQTSIVAKKKEFFERTDKDVQYIG